MCLCRWQETLELEQQLIEEVANLLENIREETGQTLAALSWQRPAKDEYEDEDDEDDSGEIDDEDVVTSLKERLAKLEGHKQLKKKINSLTLQVCCSVSS